MSTAAVDGLKKALVDAGPFSGHTIAFADRVQHAPFAHAFQQVVIRAYDHGMTSLTIAAAVIVLIGAIGAGLLLQRNPKSTEL
jgi:hypothetical protein